MTNISTTQLSVPSLHTNMIWQNKGSLCRWYRWKAKLTRNTKDEKYDSQSHICGPYCFAAKGIWSQKISAKGWGSTKLACCTMAKAISISAPSLLTRRLYLSQKEILYPSSLIFSCSYSLDGLETLIFQLMLLETIIFSWWLCFFE